MKHTVSAPFLGRTGSSERTPLLSGQREMNNVVADAEPGLTDTEISQVQLDHEVFAFIIYKVMKYRKILINLKRQEKNASENVVC